MGAGAGCNARDGYWIQIAGPHFSVGPQSMTGFFTSPGWGAQIAATNGSSVAVSRDDGCAWPSSFSLPASPSTSMPFSRSDSQIVGIDGSGGSPSTIVLAVDQQIGGQHRPHVVVSRNAGRSWSASDTGLPPSGAIQGVRVAPSDANTMYAAIGGPSDVTLLYASSDGGASWQPRSGHTGILNETITGFTVDPGRPGYVWAWGPAGLYDSEDGGRSFVSEPQLAGKAVGPVDVYRRPGLHARVVAFRPALGDEMQSTDEGLSWYREPAPPAAVTSVASGGSTASIVAASGGDLYTFLPPISDWVALLAPNKSITQVHAGHLGFYGMTRSSIEVYAGALDADSLLNKITNQQLAAPLLVTPKVPQKTAPHLGPDARVVKLRPGASKTVSYRLAIPRHTLPLDVFFLVDTSNSMSDVIGGLAASLVKIVNGLELRKIRPWIGVADFRTFPNELTPEQNSQDIVYRLDHQLAPVTPELRNAIVGLRADGGGTYESHLTALWEAVHGDAIDAWPPGPSAQDVPQGQNADFRDKALKVIVVATDEKFYDSSSGGQGGLAKAPAPTEPSFEAVEQTLSANDVYQVGLSIASKPYDDLSRVAAGTGTLAPPQGVDCNGDGTTDIAPGQPLVCRIPRLNLAEGTNLVPALINLLNSVPPLTNISFTAKSPAAVARVSPNGYSNVVEQRVGQLSFDVKYTCPDGSGGKSYPVQLRASDPQHVIARATAKVSCVAPKNPVAAAIKEAIPQGLLAAPPVAALAPVPPPPAPPVFQPLNSAQGQALPGIATQEEEQVQLAPAANNFFDEEAEQQWAMSSYKKRDDFADGAYLMLGAGAVAIMFAFGMMRVALRRSTAWAWSRRR